MVTDLPMLWFKHVILVGIFLACILWVQADWVVKVGNWGGSGGGACDMGTVDNLRDIRIRAKAAIDAIQIMYRNNGTLAWTPQYGGKGGDSNDVTFQEGEFLSSISGYYGPLWDMPNIIRSLTFVTNTNTTYGPYGQQQGTAFSIPLAAGKFLGFFGRSGNLLDAIGVYLGPS